MALLGRDSPAFGLWQAPVDGRDEALRLQLWRRDGAPPFGAGNSMGRRGLPLEVKSTGSSTISSQCSRTGPFPEANIAPGRENRKGFNSYGACCAPWPGHRRADRNWATDRTKPLTAGSHLSRYGYLRTGSMAAGTIVPDDFWGGESAADSAVDEAESRSLSKGEDAERDVEVHVESLSWRERQIRASVRVEASHQRVWEVLTAYDRLVEFIPNLVTSERIPSPQPHRTWLLQKGMQTAMYWHIEARVVLDMEERPGAENGWELGFSMVEGDFKRYEGKWYLRPGLAPESTVLHFEVNVIPKLFFPAAFLERIIAGNLPINLRAIARRAELDPAEWRSGEPNSEPARKEPKTPSPLLAYINKLAPAASQLFSPGVITAPTVESESPIAVDFDKSLSEDDRRILWKLGDKSFFDTKTCQLGDDLPCSVDEVHLRRLDDLLENGGVHRRAVVAVTVESPIKDVWNVLTDYECLSNFIPNLASCKIISRKKDHVRLVQEGCKCIMFMVLHARAVLDLWEKPDHEIVFKQVEGDFASLQGKWNLEPLGSQHTLVKYVVDVKMKQHCQLAEAIVEEVAFVDLPENLCAIRAQVELRKGKTLLENGVREKVKEEFRNTAPPEAELGLDVARKQQPAGSQEMRRKLKVTGLQKDFRVLEEQLLAFIREHGKEGYMPTRSELRGNQRVDLEKAISRMGGFSTVATRLNLFQLRRPRGYWDHFQNLHNEIVMFQHDSGMDKSYMPTRTCLKRAGRHDVARALEKWGGAREVARSLGLKARRASIQSSTKTTTIVTSREVDSDSTPPKPLKTSLPSKPRKWVEMQQDIDFSETTPT